MKLVIEVQVTGRVVIQVSEERGKLVLDEIAEMGTPMCPDDFPSDIQEDFNAALQADLMSLEIDVMDVKEYEHHRPRPTPPAEPEG
jgi:hypothetical protein